MIFISGQQSPPQEDAKESKLLTSKNQNTQITSGFRPAFKVID